MPANPLNMKLGRLLASCLAVSGLLASEHHGIVKSGGLPIPGGTVTAASPAKTESAAAAAAAPKPSTPAPAQSTATAQQTPARPGSPQNGGRQGGDRPSIRAAQQRAQGGGRGGRGGAGFQRMDV